MPDKKERRYIIAPELRVQTNDAKEPQLVGYAAVFNSLSEDLGGFREKIAPGAFKKSARKSDVRALWNHDSNFVLGRTESGTLKLKEDDRGLKVTITPPGTQWANDLLVSVDRGDVSQMSFGFRTVEDKWEIKEKENIRTLMEAELFDVSPVTFPAYSATEIGVRSIQEYSDTDLQPLLRVLMRSQHNLDLQDEDYEEIRNIITKLSTMLPVEPTPTGQNDNQPSLMKSLLALRARELGIQ